MKRLAKYKSESEASHGDGEADGSPDGAATSVEGVLSTSGPASDATVSSGEAAALKRRSNLSASTVSLALPSSTNGAESVGEQKLEPSGMVLTQRDGTSPDRIESLERRVLAGARFPSQPLGVEARERQRRPGLSGVPFSNETNSNSSSPDEEAPSKPAQVSSSPYGSLRGGSAHSDSVHSASSRQSPQPSPFLMASSGSTRGMTAYLVQSSGSMYESLPRTGSDATLNRRDGIITAQYQSTPPSPMHQSGPVILPDPQQQYTTGYIAIPTYSFGYYAVPVAVAAGHSPQSSPISPVPPMSLSNQTVPTQPSSAEQEMPSTDESVQPISRKITSTSTSTSYRTPHWPARSVVSSPGSSVFYSLPPSGRNTMQRQDAEVAGEALPAEQDHTAESGVIGDGAASSPRSSDSDQSGSSGEGDSDSDNEEQFSDASATDNSFESTSTFAGPGPLYRRPSFSGSSPLKFSAPMSDLKEEDEDVEIVLEATSFTTKTIGDTQTTVASPPLAGALLPIIQKRKKKAVSNENASVAPTAADAGGDVTIVITDEGPDSLANRKEKRNVLGAIQSKLLSWRNRGGANTRSNPPPQPRTTIVSESLTPAKAAATVTFSPNLVVSPPSPPHRPGGPVATASTAAVESPPVVLVPALKQSRSGSGAGNEGGAEGGRRRTRQVISQVSEQGSEVTLIGVGKAAGGPGEKRSSGVARVSWAVMD
ncbi:hypothetical protein DFJ73DRAFT_565918 [Zopfochytrium polystomum]|nr:hypothetical protein DFJ73DRAFT_565918 [Zopfochytrium polystomum]